MLAAVQEETASVVPTTGPQEFSLAAKQPSTLQLRKARAEAARKLGRELQEVLRHASLALLRLSEPEAISGLQSHCSGSFTAVYQLAKAADEDSNTNGTVNAMQQLHMSSNWSAVDKGDTNQFDWMQGVALQVCNS